MISVWIFGVFILVLVIVYACRMHCRSVIATNQIKQLQQQLSQRENALQDAQSVSEARNLFLAGLSHELRTPLSGIMGVTELLKESGLNDRQLEYARMVNWASTTVLEIVDDMLTFSRIHTGNLQLESVPFCISTVVDNMLAMQSIRARERGVALVRDVVASIPKIVMGDRGKLNQILLNLIGNAIKFTDEGSIIVSVELQDSAKQENNNSVDLIFSVIDTGIGIETESITNMFKPFVQGKNQSADHDRGGTGLGLAICKRLVEAMGGNISVKSTLGQGTSVQFCLSFAVPHTSIASPEPERLSNSDSFYTVLVIEDDEINRLVCTRYLALAGHHPVTAANASQTMQLLNKWQGRPDLILLDMNLGGYSGAILYQEICSANNGLWENVPVIAISADVSGASQQQALDVGITYFMAKPFSAAQLQSKMLDVLNNVGSKSLKPPISINIDQAHYQGLLDKHFIQQELADLGGTVMLELLNMFRSSSASILQNLLQAVQRRDYSLTRTHAHKLQGSAANLGMIKVMGLANDINNMARDHDHPDFAALEALVLELEQCCHTSSDAMRTMLLMYSDKGVTLAAHGYD